MHREIGLPHGVLDLRIVVHDLTTDSHWAMEVPVARAK
jgi:hypothetical protein